MRATTRPGRRSRFGSFQELDPITLIIGECFPGRRPTTSPVLMTDARAADEISSMETSAGQPEAQQQTDLALVMGPTQIASVSIVLITVVGTLCSIAYVIGRSVSAGGGRTSSVVLAAAPQRTKAASPVMSAPAPPPTATVVKAMVAAPVANVPYYQVLSVENGIAQVLAEGLALRGFSAAVSPGASSAVSRVLIGPLEEKSSAKVRADLEKLGFHPFLRRYSAQDIGAAQ